MRVGSQVAGFGAKRGLGCVLGDLVGLEQVRAASSAYERRSIAVSSNLHPSGSDELMPKTLATATVDRLRHHAHLCQTSGDSIRLSQALTGQGVKALT